MSSASAKASRPGPTGSGTSPGTRRRCFQSAAEPPMTPNPFLGVIFHWLGGLASGSFYVPYKGVRKWSWETYWLVGGFFSWIICPWLLASLLTKDLFGVLHQQSAS